ncbi:MAG TPA: hypothetical protein VMM15_38160 [Bradyrhizobium sp.]|nr:hypothetical protein [Bradyrhizobium sp.]
MPNAADETLLSLSIRDLAERFGSPVFEPHPTLRGGTATKLARTGKLVAIETAEP